MTILVREQSHGTHVYGCARPRPSHENPVLIASLCIKWYKVRLAVMFTQLMTDNGITVTPKTKRKQNSIDLQFCDIKKFSTVYKMCFIWI